MKRIIWIQIMLCFLLLLILLGCSKENFLNTKPKKSLVVPTTLEHLQAILDADNIMNGLDGIGLTPQLGEASTDNFYIPENNFDNDMRPQMQNYYLWSENPYVGVQVIDWEYPYRAILAANLVVEKLDEIVTSSDDSHMVNSLYGQAYFHQAHMYYQLAQVFAQQYVHGSAATTAGLPLRTGSDVNEVLTVSNLEDTYNFMLGRLKEAVDLLPSENNYKHRPSKQAAYALLARIYLIMGDYVNAKNYADSCLDIQDALYDYNLANLGSSSPFAMVGGVSHPVQQEVIFKCQMLSATSQGFPMSFLFALVDDDLLDLYEENDLRKQLFFERRNNGGYRFVGSYSDQHFMYFSGLAVDEIYLIRAECNIRLGHLDKGVEDMDYLMKHRYDQGRSIPLERVSSRALDWVMEERRKELIYRGLRWPDLKRLSSLGEETLLKREVNGQIYEIGQKLANFKWPFPLEVLVR